VRRRTVVGSGGTARGVAFGEVCGRGVRSVFSEAPWGGPRSWLGGGGATPPPAEWFLSAGKGVGNRGHPRAIRGGAPNGSGRLFSSPYGLSYDWPFASPGRRQCGVFGRDQRETQDPGLARDGAPLTGHRHHRRGRGDDRAGAGPPPRLPADRPDRVSPDRAADVEAGGAVPVGAAPLFRLRPEPAAGCPL